MAVVMLEGALEAARRRKAKGREDEGEEEFEQDEEKVRRTLLGPDIPGVRKILPEHMPYGRMASVDQARF